MPYRHPSPRSTASSKSGVACVPWLTAVQQAKGNHCVALPNVCGALGELQQPRDAHLLPPPTITRSNPLAVAADSEHGPLQNWLEAGVDTAMAQALSSCAGRSQHGAELTARTTVNTRLRDPVCAALGVW